MRIPAKGRFALLLAAYGFDLHAMIDAIFGAVAAGDLGHFFPDTDEHFRGISSLKLLEDAVHILQNKGYRLINIDAIAVLELPKIAPYRLQMRETIAKTVGAEARDGSSDAACSPRRRNSR